MTDPGFSNNWILYQINKKFKSSLHEENASLSHTYMSGNHRAFGLQQKEDGTILFGEALIVSLSLADDEVSLSVNL
jgi:hypothetical protein